MLLENMIKLCDSLSPVENDIAAYVIKNKEQIVKMTIQQLSDEIYVSKSAVHRFCRKVGTEPLPAKAGRFDVLLKQPKVCSSRLSLSSTSYPISKLSELLFSCRS